MAKIAETAERYDDMCDFMKSRVENFASNPLSVEERNLLSVAFKNVIGSRRASWRTLAAELDSQGEDKLLQIYKDQVEKELEAISKNVLTLLETHLISANVDKSAGKPKLEEQVFYLKMAGDYYRYLTESVYSDKNDDYKNKTKEFYDKAYEIAAEHLAPTCPIRLGLALNYSVCYYEILKDPDKACTLAKNAFDEAISKLDALEENDYKDSTLIMQLLRDNLTLWTSDQRNDDDDANVEDLDER